MKRKKIKNVVNKKQYCEVLNHTCLTLSDSQCAVCKKGLSGSKIVENIKEKYGIKT